jgi:LysR family transcriptional regulator, low CO2-responsive transcriptional regulator
MTLNQLRVFDVVARYLSITRASEALHISEPSVFQQVKSLEEACSARLYRKVGRQIELTREGRMVRADVREILLRVERLGQRFRLPLAQSQGGSLVVGASHGPSVDVAPSLLAAFKESHPQAQVVLRAESSRTVEQLMLESQIEIGLVTNPSNSPVFCVVPYRQENIVTVVSARHPLAKKNELTLAEVAQGPLIIRKASEGKTLDILRKIEDQGFQPKIFMECESAEAIKIAVMKGMGLGILYRDHVEPEVERGELKIVKVAGLKRIDTRSFIVYRKDKPLSQNAQDFLALLREPPHKTRWPAGFKPGGYLLAKKWAAILIGVASSAGIC